MAKYSSYEDIMRNKKTIQRSNRIDYRNLQIPKIQPKAKEETIEKSEMDLPPDKLLMHVQHYKTQIVSQLRSAVISTGKSVQGEEVKNIYGVNYHGPKSSKLEAQKSPEELVCAAREKIKIETFLKNNAFFKKHQLDEFLPEKPMSLFENGLYKSCGVVSSAGSLLHSKLGDKIDQDDFVIRFNAAPTKEYEVDVGSKTSLRIINSQVVANPSFKFLDESHLSPVQIFGKSPVLVWDPSGYNASLEEWYSGGADFPFFQTYFSKRLMQPESEVHLLNPKSLWSVWNWLQSESKWDLLPNPPSSGFLGLVLALLNCDTVHIYEYVPSMRLTKRCHYYDSDENLGCTIGDWHPLAAEKLLALALNIGNDTEVFADGFLTLPGLRSVQCANSSTSSITQKPIK